MADTEKTLKTRILLSYDSDDNWDNIVDFTPEKGELIVSSELLSSTEGDTDKPIRFKIGDGGKKWAELPTFYPMNPAEYATKTELQSIDLDNYYKKTETYTQDQVNDAISEAIDTAIYNVLTTPI